MSIVIPIPSKYLKYGTAESTTPLTLTIKPEISEFVASADRVGAVQLIMHQWPHSFALRFGDERDAAVFKLSFPNA